MAQTLFTGIWDAQEQLAFVRDNFPGCAVRRLANYKFEVADPIETCLVLSKLNKRDDRDAYLKNLPVASGHIKYLLASFGENLGRVADFVEFEADVLPADVSYGGQWRLFLQGSHYEGVYGVAIRLKHASRPDKWDTRGVRLDVDAFPPYVAGLDSVVESIFVGHDEAVLRESEARFLIEGFEHYLAQLDTKSPASSCRAVMVLADALFHTPAEDSGFFDLVNDVVQCMKIGDRRHRPYDDLVKESVRLLKTAPVQDFLVCAVQARLLKTAAAELLNKKFGKKAAGGGAPGKQSFRNVDEGEVERLTKMALSRGGPPPPQPPAKKFKLTAAREVESAVLSEGEDSEDEEGEEPEVVVKRKKAPAPAPVPFKKPSPPGKKKLAK